MINMMKHHTTSQHLAHNHTPFAYGLLSIPSPHPLTTTITNDDDDDEDDDYIKNYSNRIRLIYQPSSGATTSIAARGRLFQSSIHPGRAPVSS